MLPQQFIYLALIINCIGIVNYIVDTLRGKTKPNRVTWVIWSVAPLIAFAAEIKQGVGIESLFTFITGFCPLLIFLSSFVNKKSYWQISRFDIICGSMSVIGLFLWWITKVGNVAIFFSIFSDFLAALPTLKKSFYEPETESGFAFIMGALSGFVALLTVKTGNFATVAYPLYVFIMDFALAMLIQGKFGKKLLFLQKKI